MPEQPRIIRSRVRNYRDILVCAVASHMETGLEMLQKSCERFGVGLTLLGWEQPYPNHRWKLACQREAFRRLGDDHEYVLFLDAFDCLLISSLEEVFNKYLAYETPLLMSAEVNCHPPDGPAPGDYPEAPTRYRFVNSGGFIGKLSAALELLQAYDRPGYRDQREDQGFWAMAYLGRQRDMKLDHYNRVFQCLWMADDDLEHRWRRIVNVATNSKPSVIHGNGFIDMSLYWERYLGNYSLIDYWRGRCQEFLEECRTRARGSR